MLNIVLFGPPGAGKGTQSEKIIARFGLAHISTGDLLRTEMANKTELGLAARKFIDAGHLVPDEVVIGMIQNKVAAQPNAPGFIFDGFPRTVVQAIELDAMLAGMDTEISLMVSLQVSEEELVGRLLKRGRSDDNEQTIRNRLEVYKRETSPVADFYDKQCKLFVVDGIGTVEEIFDRITSVLPQEA